MSKHALSRIVSVLIGAAVLYGLEQVLGWKLYAAIPAAIAVYLVVLVGLGLMLGADKPAK